MPKTLTEKIIKDSVGISSPKIVVQFKMLSFNIFLLNFVSISQDSRAYLKYIAKCFCDTF